MAQAKDFFAPDQVAAIKEAVIAAELKTSGEIRVFIENNCGENVLDKAANVFAELELHKTEAQNAVLFYLAVEDRKFAILGDAGINRKVPADFWDKIKENMQANFRKGRFTEAMTEGISAAGDKLIEHFPYTREDINELEDDVIFG